jgi:hypothetical protein
VGGFASCDTLSKHRPSTESSINKKQMASPSGDLHPRSADHPARPAVRVVPGASGIPAPCIHSDPTRLLPFREIVFSAPENPGKTGLAAMIAIDVTVVLAGPDGADGEVYCLANDYEAGRESSLSGRGPHH